MSCEQGKPVWHHCIDGCVQSYAGVTHATMVLRSKRVADDNSYWVSVGQPGLVSARLTGPDHLCISLGWLTLLFLEERS